MVRRYRVDGVLAVPIRETSAEWYNYVKRLDVPVVTITRRAEGLDCFYVDHPTAGAQVAACLAEQGYRRFLFIGKDYDGKYVGFRQWLAEHGFGDAVTNRVLGDHDDFRRELEHWLAESDSRAAVLPATTSMPCRPWIFCGSCRSGCRNRWASWDLTIRLWGNS